MPLVTSYQVISDQEVTFGAETISDAHFQFQIPDDVTPRGDAILAFKVNPQGTATLRVRLNNDVLLTVDFDTAPNRSWHEVFSASSLKTEEGNELIMSSPADSGGGSFTVSDIVVFFQTPIG